MGSSMAIKCNQYCTDTNQSIERDRINGLNISRSVGTLYGGKHSSESSDDNYGHGEADLSSYSNSGTPEPTDPMEGAQRAQIMASFRAAVEKGNTSLIKYYFEEHPNLHWGRNRWKNGDTCLHVAVRMRDVKLIQMLLTVGPQYDININDQNSLTQDTPLHVAVRDAHKDDVEIVSLLIDQEAQDLDVNTMNAEFYTPLRIAVEQRKYSIMDLLSKYALDLETFNYDAEVMESMDSDVDVEDDRMSFGRVADAFGNREPSESLDPDDIPLVTGNIVMATQRLESTHDLWNSKIPQFSVDPVDPFGSELEVEDGHTPSDDTPQELPVDTPQRRTRSLTMEEKMDDEARETLKRLKLKSKNPFSKVRVTKQDSVSLTQSLREMEQLEDLNGFLMKQTHKPPHNWHKRWVLVTDNWILWNDKLTAADFGDDGPTIEDRKRFKGAVNFDNIVAVDKTGNSGRKFVVHIRYETHEKLHERMVYWKCLNEEQRDFWVNGLNHYLDYNQNLKKLYSL